MSRPLDPKCSRLVARVRTLAARLEVLPPTLRAVIGTADRFAAVEPDLSALDVNPFAAVPAPATRATVDVAGPHRRRRSAPPAPARPPTDSRDAAARGPARRSARPSSGPVTAMPPAVHPGAAPDNAAAAVAVLPVAVRQRTEPGQPAARQESVADGSLVPRPVPAGSLTDRSAIGGSVRATGTAGGNPVRADGLAAAAPGPASVQAAALWTDAGSGAAAAASAGADLAALADALLAAGRGGAVPNAVPADPVLGAAARLPAPLAGPAQSRPRPSAAPEPSSSVLLDIGRGFSLLDRLAREASAPGPGTIGNGPDAARAVKTMESGALQPVLDGRPAAGQHGGASGAGPARPVLDPFGRADAAAEAGAAVDVVRHALAAQLARHGVDPT